VLDRATGRAEACAFGDLRATGTARGRLLVATVLLRAAPFLFEAFAAPAAFFIAFFTAAFFAVGIVGVTIAS
jgi:hypothetical protein